MATTPGAPPKRSVVYFSTLSAAFLIASLIVTLHTVRARPASLASRRGEKPETLPDSIEETVGSRATEGQPHEYAARCQVDTTLPARARLLLSGRSRFLQELEKLCKGLRV